MNERTNAWRLRARWLARHADLPTPCSSCRYTSTWRHGLRLSSLVRIVLPRLSLSLSAFLTRRRSETDLGMLSIFGTAETTQNGGTTGQTMWESNVTFSGWGGGSVHRMVKSEVYVTYLFPEQKIHARAPIFLPNGLMGFKSDHAGNMALALSLIHI